ncbi:hypothetical protein V6N11_069315 [Hibiscus sabdariffa]|uniref:BHLH domain-containing protein n=1 Tax=Hibiscus sabdariffa TaxID=183260 RepID=A0ABR1ZZ94_9ROSI
MESLQEPISPCFFGDQLDVDCLERAFVNSELLSFGGEEEEEEEEEEEARSTILSLEDKMPFLQMLQSVESHSPQLFAFKNPNFQTLLRLQQLNNNDPFMETQTQALELESCVTREAFDLHSPVKSDTNNHLAKKSGFSTSCFEVVSFESNQNAVADDCSKTITKSPLVARERRKRKRTKPAKNKEEVESHRMTHIAVERNRRRQMNDYLNSLRSLMPPAYIQRGDQASIIGGAIDFVKELEQLVQSMEAQKRMKRIEESNNNSSSNSDSKSSIEFSQPEVVKGESKAGAAEIEVNVIHNHVNLKIQCERRPGQLVQAIVTLESLRLTVLHLNITSSSQASVLYSFNLKMEDDCKLRSADEISAAVHRIFS